MGLLSLALIGAVAGWLASRTLRIGADPLVTVAIGIVGAVVGGLILRGILAFLGGILGAVLGALALIWLARAYLARR